MSTATVTVREVRNKETGIDLTIPSQREISGMFGSTTEYEIVVVTNLSAFKSPKHTEADVVQFMVPKKLADFEVLRHKLEEKFCGSCFPVLPKKGLFSGDGKERRGLINNFVKYIACAPKLATCPLVYNFLGASRGEGLLRGGRLSVTDDTDRDSAEEDRPSRVTPVKSPDLFGEDEEEVEDLFPESREEPAAEPETLFPTVGVERFDFGNRSNAKTRVEPQLFSEQDYGGPVDVDDILRLVGSLDDEETAQQSRKMPEEDNFDLLNIDDDLDQLFIKSTPQTRTSPETGDKTEGKLENSEASTKSDSNKNIPDKPTVSEDLSKPTKPLKPQLPNKPGKPPLAVKPSQPVAAARPTIPKRPSKTRVEAAVETPSLSKTDDNAEFRPVPKPRTRLSRTSSSDKSSSDEIPVATNTNTPSQSSSKGDDVDSSAMDSDNLLKYIEENASTDKTDLDLFS